MMINVFGPGNDVNAATLSKDKFNVLGHKEVKRLEVLRDGLQPLVVSGRDPEVDPKGGCFCQGERERDTSDSDSFYA